MSPPLAERAHRGASVLEADTCVSKCLAEFALDPRTRVYFSETTNH
jgi:hypothetical protein